MLPVASLALSAAAVAVLQVSAYPEPLNMTGAYTGVHDPSLARRGDGLYFLFCTGDNLQIRTSPDLVNWTSAGTMWPDGNPNATVQYTLNYTSLWAPDVTWVGDRFLAYYSASSFGSQNSGIFLAESTTGESGSWTDRGLVTSTTNTTEGKYNAIDPNLFIDDDGSWYLQLGSWWNGIQQFRLDPLTGHIFENSTRTNLSKRPVGTAAQEAPFLVKTHGWYYLFTAFDVCCAGISSTYNVRVSRSRSVSGPFIDQSGALALNGGGNAVVQGHGLTVGPGGQSLFFEDGNWSLIYHYYVADGSSNVARNYLDFSTGWPVLV